MPRSAAITHPDVLRLIQQIPLSMEDLAPLVACSIPYLYAVRKGTRKPSNFLVRLLKMIAYPQGRTIAIMIADEETLEKKVTMRQNTP